MEQGGGEGEGDGDGDLPIPHLLSEGKVQNQPFLASPLKTAFKPPLKKNVMPLIAVQYLTVMGGGGTHKNARGASADTSNQACKNWSFVWA